MLFWNQGCCSEILSTNRYRDKVISVDFVSQEVQILKLNDIWQNASSQNAMQGIEELRIEASQEPKSNRFLRNKIVDGTVLVRIIKNLIRHLLRFKLIFSELSSNFYLDWDILIGIITRVNCVLQTKVARPLWHDNASKINFHRSMPLWQLLVSCFCFFGLNTFSYFSNFRWYIIIAVVKKF